MQIVAMAIGVVVGALLKYELSPTPYLLQGWHVLVNDLAVLTQPIAWIVVPTSALLVGACETGRKMIGAPWLWGVVKVALDTLRRDLFDGHNAPDHHHRITLFRYRGWILRPCRWPGSGWLVPVARSGHSTQKTGTKFRAPSEPTRAEGIAGRSYVTKGTLFVPPPNAAPLPRVGKDASAPEIEEYAKRTFIDQRWITRQLEKRDDELPRSYVGFLIEVKGKPWGVIVIDSAEPALDPKLVQRGFNLIGGTLSKVLEGVL